MKTWTLLVTAICIFASIEPARAGPWEAHATGRAAAGPSASGTDAVLSFRLENDYDKGIVGFDRAESDPVTIRSIDILVPPVKDGQVGLGIVRMSISLAFRTGYRNEFVSIGGDFAIPTIVIDDDAYTADVTTRAVSIASRAQDDADQAHDGPNSSGASAQTGSDADGGGDQPARLFIDPIWDFSSQHFVSIDGGPEMLVFMTEFARDQNGHVTATNLTTNVPDGPLPIGDFTATGSFSQDFTFGPGAHTLVFRDRLFGFLQSQAIPEPDTSLLLVVGLGGLAAGRLVKRRRAEPGSPRR